MRSIIRGAGQALAPYLTQQNLVAGAALAGRAYRARQAARQGRAQNVTNGSAPLTGQFDYKTDYSRRRKSKRQRRRSYRRSKRRRRLLNIVKTSAIAPVHLVRRSMFGLTTATQKSDAVSYGMYGLNGTANDTFNTCDDIASIFKQMDKFSWDNALAPNVPTNNHKLWFMHATLEFTIRNTGNQDALIEAYFIRGRRSVDLVWGNPTNLYSGGFRRQNLARDPNTPAGTFERELAFTDIGVTPFQNSLFCKSYNIYKRQKFRIPPGGEINFVVSDRRPRTFTMVSSYPVVTDRRYHGVLFQQQGSPDATSGAETVALPTTVTYLATRRYRFKMIRDSLVTDAFDTTATTHGLPDPA